MTNYFQFLSIPQSYEIDLSELEAAYFNAQRQFHPDRVARLDANAQLIATQQSMTVNEAYQTLKNPLKRAKYLLSLHGIDVLDSANKAKASPELLMEVMELQEAKAEARTPEAKLEFNNKVGSMLNKCEADLQDAFRKNDLELAKSSTIRLSYLYKLHESF